MDIKWSVFDSFSPPPPPKGGGREMRCYPGAQLVVLPLQQHVVILCVFQNCPAGTNFRVEENSRYSVNRGFQIPICVTLQWLKLFPHVPRTSSATALPSRKKKREFSTWTDFYISLEFWYKFVKLQLVLGPSLFILDRLNVCFKNITRSLFKGCWCSRLGLSGWITDRAVVTASVTPPYPTSHV